MLLVYRKNEAVGPNLLVEPLGHFPMDLAHGFKDSHPIKMGKNSLISNSHNHRSSGGAKGLGWGGRGGWWVGAGRRVGTGSPPSLPSFSLVVSTHSFTPSILSISKVSIHDWLKRIKSVGALPTCQANPLRG